MYRFTRCASKNDPHLREDFLSDRESGKRPAARERAIPELQDGMSTFGSLAAAQARWLDLREFASARGEAVRAGYYIAEVVLRPGIGFELEDLDEVDEHLMVWGDADDLTGSVIEIYPAATNDG